MKKETKKKDIIRLKNESEQKHVIADAERKKTYSQFWKKSFQNNFVHFNKSEKFAFFNSLTFLHIYYIQINIHITSYYIFINRCH